MRRLLILGLTASLIGTSSICGAQTPQGEPYDFKGDQLGMDLEQFKLKHREPGAWLIQNVCVNQQCKPEKVWKPRLDCKEDASVTAFCSFSSTIAEIPAAVTAFFVDKKLVTINVSFAWRDEWFVAVAQALTAKLGAPVSRTDGRSGPVLRWDNETSVALIQLHACYSPRLLGPDPRGWSDEIVSLLRGQDCADRGLLTYQQSRVLFVHRALGAAAQQRIDEAIRSRAARSRSDI